MKKLILILFVVFLAISSAYAQSTVYLKSGRVVEGEVVDQTDKYIKLAFSGVELTFWLDEVERIQFADGSEIFPAAQMPPTEEIEELIETTPFIEEQPVIEAPSSATPFAPAAPAPFEEVPTYETGVANIPGFTTGSGADMLSEEEMIKAAQTAMAFFAVGGVLAFISYLFMAFCLQVIARKTQTANGWFAWIPIANLILMCDIAGKPRWWAALFLLVFIPFIGSIAVAVVSVMLFIGIAQRRGKPVWVGVLMIIPLVNLGVLGYIAFSDSVSSVEVIERIES
ncbi:DUF5684 domain-containing protein [Candidatus Omnitrophota bacterium]